MSGRKEHKVRVDETERKKMEGGRTRGILFQSQSFLLPMSSPFPSRVSKLLICRRINFYIFQIFINMFYLLN